MLTQIKKSCFDELGGCEEFSSGLEILNRVLRIFFTNVIHSYESNAPDIVSRITEQIGAFELRKQI